MSRHIHTNTYIMFIYKHFNFEKKFSWLLYMLYIYMLIGLMELVVDTERNVQYSCTLILMNLWLMKIDENFISVVSCNTNILLLNIYKNVFHFVYFYIL